MNMTNLTHNGAVISEEKESISDSESDGEENNKKN